MVHTPDQHPGCKLPAEAALIVRDQFDRDVYLPIHDPLGNPPIPAETIDLTPDPRGFASIVLLFAENILDDVKVARKVNDRILLISLIENIASLAQTSPAEVAFVIERLNSRVPAADR